MTPSHRLKLRRAAQHLNALRTHAQRWAETEPIVVVGDCEVETRQHFIRLRVSEPVGDMVPLLIGDCAHCLRQALDHLAYRLAIVVLGSDPPPNGDSTAFPITSSLNAFNGGLPSKVGPRKLMPAGLYDALEEMQPYHGGDWEFLWHLHQLDNLDKHRFPPVVAGSVDGGRVDLSEVEIDEITFPGGGAGGPVDDSVPVLQYTLLTEGSEQAPHVEITPAITFGSGSSVTPDLIVVPVLDRIRQLIWDDVLPRLEPFL